MTVKSDLEEEQKLKIHEAAGFYREAAPISNGDIRKIPRAKFLERMATHGVDEDMAKKVQAATDFELTAAATAAMLDLEERIQAADPEDLKNDDYRRHLSNSVRLPTFGGSTTATVHAEKISNVPGRPDADGNMSAATTKTTYGATTTKINAKGRIFTGFHNESRDRIRAALGIDE